MKKQTKIFFKSARQKWESVVYKLIMVDVGELGEIRCRCWQRGESDFLCHFFLAKRKNRIRTDDGNK